jgi:alpha-tubulin suppressor-like RCC1 family protein
MRFLSTIRGRTAARATRRTSLSRNPKASLLSGLMALLALLTTWGLAAPTATAQEGRVKAWGSNANQALGDGAATTSRLTPAAVAGLTPSDISALSAGYEHSLALLSNGTVESWGRNSEGELGIGTVAVQSVPATVNGLTGVRAVAAGSLHNLALLSDGTVKSWGYNNAGQLGDNTVTTRTTPVTVSGLTNVEAIAAGGYFSLALLSDGTVMAWGTNTNGQLGDNTVTNRTTPVAVSGLTGVRAIAAGISHSLALMGDGTVKAWGLNTNGQLGDNTVTQRNTPVAVSGLTGVRAISGATHGNHSMALLSDGTVKNWGSNTSGQLGDGTTTDRTTPVFLDGVSNVRAISAGSSHSLALTREGQVKSVGSNAGGQLGDGTTANRVNVVTPVTGLSSVSLIAAGSSFSLAA